MRRLLIAGLVVVFVPISTQGANAQDFKAKFIEKAMEMFDKDGNGQLDAEEMKAALDYRRRMKQEREAKEGDAEDKPAPKKLTEAEMLAKYDINGNGRLDPEERLLAEQDHEKPEPKKEETDEPEDTSKLVGEESWEDFEKRLIAKYDENDNGKLDIVERRKATGEIAKWRADQRKIKAQKEAAIRGLSFDERRLLSMFDDNKDYRLDEEELTFARKQFGKLRKGGLDALVELRARLITEFDTNKNGKLDEREKPLAEQFAKRTAVRLITSKPKNWGKRDKDDGDRKGRKVRKRDRAG